MISGEICVSRQLAIGIRVEGSRADMEQTRENPDIQKTRSGQTPGPVGLRRYGCAARDSNPEPADLESAAQSARKYLLVSHNASTCRGVSKPRDLVTWYRPLPCSTATSEQTWSKHGRADSGDRCTAAASSSCACRSVPSTCRASPRTPGTSPSERADGYLRGSGEQVGDRVVEAAQREGRARH